MPENIAPDAVQEILTAHNISFRVSDIQHGRQFRFDDGAILSSYDSGKIVWQGKDTAIADRVKKLLGPNPPPSDVISRDIGPMEIRHVATNKVFIVYGHDVECREQLELLLRRMRLEPVILQNLVGGGQTIIEKLESSLDVRYACVLLTPDDEGYPARKPG